MYILHLYCQCFRQRCSSVPRQQCSSVPSGLRPQQCPNLCQSVPRQVCVSVPRQQCVQVSLSPSPAWWHVTCPRCPGSLWPAALCPSSSAPTCAPMCTGARWLIAWLEKYFLKGVYVLGLYKLRRIGKVWKSMYLCIICFNVNEMKLKYKVHWNIIWFISALQAIKCWYAYFSTFNTRGDHIEPCNCKEHNINKRKNNQILKMKRPSLSVNKINLTSSFLNFLYSL